MRPAPFVLFSVAAVLQRGNGVSHPLGPAPIPASPVRQGTVRVAPVDDIPHGH
jgi:hypothetical protein